MHSKYSFPSTLVPNRNLWNPECISGEAKEFMHSSVISLSLSSLTSQDRGCDKDETRKRTVSRGFNGPFEDEGPVGSRVVLGLGTGVAFNNTCPTISCYLDQRRALFLNSFSL